MWAKLDWRKNKMKKEYKCEDCTLVEIQEFIEDRKRSGVYPWCSIS